MNAGGNKIPAEKESLSGFGESPEEREEDRVLGKDFFFITRRKRLRAFDWRLAVVFLLFFIAGACLGIWLSRRSSGSEYGDTAFRDYLDSRLQLVEDTICEGIRGEVVIGFHVDRKGRPVQVKVEKGLCPEADREAVRLVREGPDWPVSSGWVRVKVPFGQ